MTTKYLRPHEKQLERKWIGNFALVNLLKQFPDTITIQVSDMGSLLIFREDVCLGYIDFLDGRGTYIKFRD